MKRARNLVVLAVVAGVSLSLVHSANAGHRPKLFLPANIVAEADRPTGAIVTYTATGVDERNRPLRVVCSPSSGSVFPLGQTTVRCDGWKERDDEDDDPVVSGSFTVTVRDTTAPALGLPANFTVEATGADGARASYPTPTATDIVDGSRPVSCNRASGSLFPIGDTQVSCTASDTRGNTASGSFKVTVRDTAPPALELPVNLSAEAVGPAGAPVAYSAKATDLVDGAVAVSCEPPSGSTFPLGQTTVPCSATDSRGNRANGSFPVTIRDTTAPILGLPGGVDAEATSADGATISFETGATDTVDGAVAVTCNPASGAVFPIGVTEVSCTASDSRGNQVSGSFGITIRDPAPPVLHLPGDVVAEAAGADGATVEYAASATDAVDGAVPIACAPASGSRFPLGDTQVTCRASDRRGNESSGSFRLSVRDTTAPVVSVPDSPVAEAQGPDGIEVAYSAATGVDAVDGPVAVSCLPASGSLFPLDDSEVTCSARDSRGNTGSASFTVSVRDTSPPALLLPADRVAEASGPDGAEVAYSAPTATDAVDGPVGASCHPASGSVFPLGETRVDCSARDSRGNAVWGSFFVRVGDAAPPTLDLPGDLVAEATAPGGATLEYVARAADLVEGSLPVSCDAPSGSVFALGETEVTCTASDSLGNEASATFAVTVRDTRAPVLELSGDRAAEATGPGGARIEYESRATDAVDGSVGVTCSRASGSVFPLGETEVTCSASDSRDNKASASFAVTVRDTTAPALELPADVAVEATQAGGQAIDYEDPPARDLVDGEVAVSCEPAAGFRFPLGETEVSCTAADSRGNRASGSFTVRIRDTTPPALALPDDLTAEASGADGVPVEYEAEASDAVDGALEVACSFSSGTTFALGETEITCTAADSRGNGVSGSFTVRVRDTTAPALVVPSDRVAEAAGPEGAAVEYAASATDLVDGAVAVSCDAASGSVFPLGETDVACTARDTRGNAVDGSFTVTVRDTTAPVLDRPDEVIVEATGPDGAEVEYETTAADAVDGVVAVACEPTSGSVLPLGETEVECRASDSRGNESSGVFLAKVHDRKPPVLKLPDDIVAEATGPNGAIVEYVATATDAVDGAVAVTCAPTSGSVFPLGSTEVACSAKDSKGNRASGSFRVTARDTTAPALSVSDDLVAEATGATGAEVEYEASATDLVDGVVPVRCTKASGAVYPLGETNVSCNAEDDRDNEASDSFKVTVRDTTPPALEEVEDVVAEAAGTDGATIEYEAPSASDLVDGEVTVGCEPASGSLFPVGETEVACRARDSRGNEASRVFVAKVRDRRPPVLDLPDDLVAEATGPGGAKVEYEARAADAVDGSVTVRCDLAPGALFPLGETAVVCTALDESGNEATAGFSVTVLDTTAPALVVPDDVVVEATGPGGASVEYETKATDVVDGAVEVSCDAASGAVYPLGEREVACTASDSRGNRASRSFGVVVRDTIAPALTLPADLVAEATGPDGAEVEFEAAAIDAVDGAVELACGAASGAIYPLGETEVSCTASDSRGNERSASFVVAVRDTTAPSLRVPDALELKSDADEVSATLAEIEAFLSAAEAVDAVDPAPGVTHDAPASFRRGKTVVSFTAVDAAGNRAVRVSSVTVRPEREEAPPATDSGAPAGDGGQLSQPASVGPDPAPGGETADPPASAPPAGTAGPARARALFAPSDGARVRRSPLLAWRRVARATYYNVQVYRNGRKVLSTWPTRARLRLRASWVYKGRRIKLKPGVYRWFVWPGYGKQKRARYGALLGASTFVVVRNR